MIIRKSRINQGYLVSKGEVRMFNISQLGERLVWATFLGGKDEISCDFLYNLKQKNENNL